MGNNLVIKPGLYLQSKNRANFVLKVEQSEVDDLLYVCEGYVILDFEPYYVGRLRVTRALIDVLYKEMTDPETYFKHK